MMDRGDDSQIHAPDGDPAVGMMPDPVSREWLVSFLLLCLTNGDSLGHELEERIQAIGFHGTHPMEVYQTLRRMEDDGLI